MKANELMIDDWVSLFQGNPDGSSCNVQVSYIGEYGEVGVKGCEEYTSANCNLLFPIPITAQILKKNGFEKVNGEYQDVFYCCDGLDLLIDDRIEPYGYTLYGVLELHIKYLHQLQHALRLAGIDKEIEL